MNAVEVATDCKRLIRALTLALAWTVLAVPAFGADVSKRSEIPEASADRAVAVFIREGRMVGKARTMFVYADQQLLGVLDNDTWTYAELDPGEYTLWLNWAKVTHKATLEAGKVYFFNVPFSGFVEVDEATGRALVNAVKGFTSPTAKEEKTAQQHVTKRYGKAQQAAAKAPAAKPATGKGQRARHIEKWPKVDLDAYAVLYVEDFAMADPKAGERKDQHLVETAGGRLASMLVQNLADSPFDEVRRGSPEGDATGALIVRGRITQYKPGSAAARFVVAGAGAARMDFALELVDAATGEVVTSFADERSYGYGGVMGAAGGIESIEQNLAYELGLYLTERKGSSR